MSAFLTKLEVESVSDRLWRVTSRLVYQSDIDGLIIVPEGFLTDLMSTWGVPVVAEFLDGDDSPPAVIHDYLYSDGWITRKTADAILREACIANGTSQFKAFIIWAGVRLFGWTHFNRLKGAAP